MSIGESKMVTLLELENVLSQFRENTAFADKIKELVNELIGSKPM